MMRLQTRSTILALLMQFCLVLSTSAASAEGVLEVIWTGTTGSGVVGTDTIGAEDGDLLTAEVRVTAGAEGALIIGPELEFDAALDDELNLISATNLCDPACGVPTLFGPSLVTQESTTLVAGSVSGPGAIANPLVGGPVSSTFAVAQLVFVVNSATTD